MSKGPFNFPAEAFLADVPPNYPLERFLLTAGLIVTFAFFMFLPVLMATPVKVDGEGKVTSTKTTTVKYEELSSSGKSKKKGKGKNPSKKTDVTAEKSKQEEEVTALEVNPMIQLLSVAGAIVSMAAMVAFLSPDNYYTTNGIFQAPLLTAEECQTILRFADEAAAENYVRAQESEASHALEGTSVNRTVEQLLKDPEGWNKLRHQEYPTTDLNLVTDPFTKEHRDWIKEKLDARLAPIIQRIWGIPPSSIRANDMFVVRYDENKRTRLVNHTDDGYISINVLLDDGFEGGGTRFWDRNSKAPFAHVHPTDVGQVLLHGALINHEGMHVEKGRRTIFVGFLEVDRVDPFKPGYPMTGLTWYSSWGSLFWLATKLKQGYHAVYTRMQLHKDDWKNNKYIRSFMGTAKMYLSDLTDSYFPHKVHNLVDSKNRDAFINALEQAYERGEPTIGGKASWFEGQQVDIDITGKIIHQWSTRSNNPHRFEEL